MAQFQYDVLLTDNKYTLVKSAGSSIATSAIRLTIDTANATSKADVQRLIEILTQKITEDTWPPT
jgi:hypothetical protein